MQSTGKGLTMTEFQLQKTMNKHVEASKDALKLLMLVRIKTAEQRLTLEDQGAKFDARCYEMLSESIMSTLRRLLPEPTLAPMMIEMMEAVAEDPSGARTKMFLDNIINRM